MNFVFYNGMFAKTNIPNIRIRSKELLNSNHQNYSKDGGH